MEQYLYRGINRKEKDLGSVLVPKSQESFKAHPRLPIDLPFNLGKQSEHAVRDHQHGAETSGVSTSLNLDVAKRYAGEGIVVKIDRKRLKEFGIREYVAEKDGHMAIKPEDYEVILVNEELEVFPKEIVIEAIDV